MSFDWNNFYRITWILFLLVMMTALCYVQNNDIEWHRQEVYDSWERQAEMNFDYENKISVLKSQVSDLNTQLEVYKIIVMYERE